MMIKIANFLKNLKKDDKGFTLIELMVVIAVLGILAALIIPQFANVSNKAEKANAQSTAQALASAAAMVYAENPSGFASAGSKDTYMKGKITEYMSNYPAIETQYGPTNITFGDGTVTVKKSGTTDSVAKFY